MKTRNFLRILFVALGMFWAVADAGTFKDPFDVPATLTPLASSSTLTGVTQTPSGRLVAVGRRGHILISDDGGKRWTQAPCPLSSDLIAVQFVDSQQGWVVGHNGVVLHTNDGGATWRKQLDGKQAADILVKHYEARAGDERSARILYDARRFQEEGPGRPFLDLWFDDAQHGFIVGAYNLIFRTADGGKTWEPWSDRVPNEKGMHLNAIRKFGDDLYIAGEQGYLWRLNPQSQQFERVATPYRGTYFGLTGKSYHLVIFGLRGHAFRSEDRGKTWKQIETGVDTGLSAGVVLKNDRLVLVSIGGEILSGDLAADRLKSIVVKQPMPYSSVVANNAGLVLVGARGVRLQALQ